MSHRSGYRGRMSPKRHTGYGVWDISRQVARRVQQERERVESPSFALKRMAEWAPLPPKVVSPTSREKRPWAA